MRFRFHYPVMLLLLIMSCAQEKPLSEKSLAAADMWVGAEEAVLAIHRKHNAYMLDTFENCIFEKTIKTSIDSSANSVVYFDSFVIKNCYSVGSYVSFSLIKDITENKLFVVELSDIRRIHYGLDSLYGEDPNRKLTMLEVQNESLKELVTSRNDLYTLSRNNLQNYLRELIVNIYRFPSVLSYSYFNDIFYFKSSLEFPLEREYGINISTDPATAWFFGKDTTDDNVLIFDMDRIGYLIFEYSIVENKVILKEYFIPHKILARHFKSDILEVDPVIIKQCD